MTEGDIRLALAALVERTGGSAVVTSDQMRRAENLPLRLTFEGATLHIATRGEPLAQGQVVDVIDASAFGNGLPWEEPDVEW